MVAYYGRGAGVGRGRSRHPRGVGEGFRHSIIATESIRQPCPAMLLSLPIRHRSIIVVPAWGRFTPVLINSPELPVQACRPANGLPQQLLIVPLYPPLTNVPPAARTS